MSAARAATAAGACGREIMGNGLRQIARDYGGLVCCDAKGDVAYVLIVDANTTELEIQTRRQNGWQWAGVTEDGEFLIFKKSKEERNNQI